jgi:hypothetical protein
MVCSGSSPILSASGQLDKPKTPNLKFTTGHFSNEVQKPGFLIEGYAVFASQRTSKQQSTRSGKGKTGLFQKCPVAKHQIPSSKTQDSKLKTRNLDHQNEGRP